MVQLTTITGDDATKVMEIVQTAPFKFCDFESEPSGYLETAIAN